MTVRQILDKKKCNFTKEFIMSKRGFSKFSLIILTLLSLGVLEAFANHSSDPYNSGLRRRPSVRPGDNIFHQHNHPQPPPYGHYGYGCGDHAVQLLCKVRGDGISGNRYVTAYTNCSYYGIQPEGSYCTSVETPGFYQVKMRLEFQCINGQWVWSIGNGGFCELSR